MQILYCIVWWLRLLHIPSLSASNQEWFEFKFEICQGMKFVKCETGRQEEYEGHWQSSVDGEASHN